MLYVAGNGLFNNSYYDVYETYKADYIEHLNWLAKISLKFPKLKSDLNIIQIIMPMMKIKFLRIQMLSL